MPHIGDNDVMFWLGTYLFYLRDDLYVILSRTNPFKEEGDDINQVRSKFYLKMPIDFFYKIKHISQNVHYFIFIFYR